MGKVVVLLRSYIAFLVEFMGKSIALLAEVMGELGSPLVLCWGVLLGYGWDLDLVKPLLECLNGSVKYYLLK